MEGLLLRPRAGVTAAAPGPAREALATRASCSSRCAQTTHASSRPSWPTLRCTPSPAASLPTRTTARVAASRGALARRRSGLADWGPRDRATHAPVGTVQATITGDASVRRAALAWVVATSRQGEGLATEAARAVRDWLRVHGVTRFVAHIHPDHAASAAVAQHLGLAATDELCGGEVLWAGC